MEYNIWKTLNQTHITTQIVVDDSHDPSLRNCRTASCVHFHPFLQQLYDFMLRDVLNKFPLLFANTSTGQRQRCCAYEREAAVED